MARQPAVMRHMPHSVRRRCCPLPDQGASHPELTTRIPEVHSRLCAGLTMEQGPQFRESQQRAV